MLICFESIFPALAGHWCRLGANILINLTNDAWYGRSSAPEQQISMVVLRAVENRRSLARAANTGISVFIDPLGRIKEASPIFKEYQMSASLPLMRQQSFYTRMGYLFAPLCLLILSLMILYGIYSRGASRYAPTNPI
jgi:apolipoprotein N-acyltransferase